MFYTTYRPQKFSEISKPNQVADALATQIKSGKTAHAYLFIGPRGTGKTTTARILAKSLNCENLLPTGDPCCQCNFCTQIQQNNFTDLIEIDAASNRGIDDIRSLREKVKLSPVSGKYKIYIIDEVHMLTNEAFNALLKTLEEPPKHVVFMLCTTEEHKVPETIKSRCQVYKFKRATVEQLVAKLEKICETEGIKVFSTKEEFNKSKASKKILETDLKKIAKNANGGFRDAETLLEQYVESDGVYLDDGNTTPAEFIYLVLSKDQKSALTELSTIYETGKDVSNFSSEIIYFCRDLLLCKSGVTSKFTEETSKMAEKFEPVEIVTLLNLLLEAHIKIKTSIIPQLPLELAVVTYCDSGDYKGKSKKPQSMLPNNDSDDEFDTTINLSAFRKITNVDTDAAENSETTELETSVSVDIESIMENVLQKWEEIVNAVSQINNSVMAILKASKPIRIDGDYLVLEVMYKFHKERLESTKNRELVEQVILAHAHGIKSIKCVLSDIKPKTMNKFESGDLTDLNISPVSNSSISKDNATGFFDGGLPIA